MSRIEALGSSALCLLAAFAAHAQVAPVKPGLWQIHMDRETNGRKAPDISERLNNMPPARRAQMEAMLKDRGVDASGNVAKICQTPEMLDTKKFANPVPGCKITYSTRTNASWKSHTSCPETHLESDGEILFTNSENYTVKTVSTTKSGAQTRTSHMTITGKWLSADCGNIKPVTTRP